MKHSSQDSDDLSDEISDFHIMETDAFYSTSDSEGGVSHNYQDNPSKLHPHLFQESSTPTKICVCEYCGEVIWGLFHKALVCENCNLTCHVYCAAHLLVANHECTLYDENKNFNDDKKLAKRQLQRKRSSMDAGRLIPKEGEHHFHRRSVKVSLFSLHCNVCREIITPLLTKYYYSCSICSYSIHRKCLGKVCHNCRASFQDPKEPVRHHWVEGNIRTLSSKCIYCRKICGVATVLIDHRCSWCQKTVHTHCLQFLSSKLQLCDLGPNRKNIISPTHIRCIEENHDHNYNNNNDKDDDDNNNNKYREQEEKGRQGCFLAVARDFYLVDPIIVFVNKKSGGLIGSRLLRKMAMSLNYRQVIDLVRDGPERGVTLIKNLSKCRILVCGGDGTFGWVLEALRKENISFPAGILPLGTGNDLAQYLNWGSSILSLGNMKDYIQQIFEAEPCPFDRWGLFISRTTNYTQNTRTLRLSEIEQEVFSQNLSFVMNNYFSVGFDANITLAFHQRRKDHPEKFTSQIGNKIQYTLLAADQMFGSLGQPRQQKISDTLYLIVDGQIINIPHAESLVILNLPTYGGGNNIWGTGSFSHTRNSSSSSSETKENQDREQKKKKWLPPSSSDKILEVGVFKNIQHLALVGMKLSKAIKIAQGKEIEIGFKTNEPIAIQIDGEPFTINPCNIKFKHLEQVQVLKKKTFDIYTLMEIPNKLKRNNTIQ